MSRITKRVLSRVGLVLFLLIATSATGVLAQTLAPGISKGNIFYYEMYAHYSSSNPNAQIKVPEFEANNTDWVRIEVSEVNGSEILLIYTLHFKNNSEQTIAGQTDILKTSWGSDPTDFRGVPICPANLNTGDIIPAVQLSINETVTRIYLGIIREINHVKWTNPEEDGECYFDRKTGVLIELIRTHAFTNPNTGDEIKKTDLIKITSTNTWTPSEPSALLVPTLLIAGAGIGAALLSTKLISKK